MNERISELIDTLKISKTAFAEKLNVSQAFISQICSGVKKPSDRTVADICAKFNVNEKWLRKGEGSMFVEMSRDEVISQYLGELVKSTDPEVDFQKRFVRALAQLSIEEWKMIESFVESIKKNE